MDQTDSEQLVVGQDARDRRRRLIKWLSIGLAVLVVITISVVVAYPLTKRPPRRRFEVPTTLIIEDKSVHLVFGEGEGKMVTEAIIEVSYVVDCVTVHMNETIISDRADYDNKDKVYDPVVKFDTTRSDTGTLVRYTVGSKYHPEDSAHFKLTVLIPPFFEGDLTIDGTNLDIKTWRLGTANLRLLHLSTDVGNITFYNGSRIDPGYGIYQPTMRTKALYANIRQHGSIYFSAPMLAQEYPHDFHAHIETREGDIIFEAVTNMFNAMPYGNQPWDRKDMTDTLHYFNVVAHKGNIHFDVRLDGVVRGPWYAGMTRVDAKAEAGSVHYAW